MADDNFDAAHLAYVAARTQELKQETLAEFQELGRTCGVEITSLEEITPELVERLPGLLARQLERWGNPDLAERLRQAHTAVWAALREQGRLLALQQERPLTPAEQGQDAAIAVRVEELSEHFERVQADVSAYLKHVARHDDDDRA